MPSRLAKHIAPRARIPIPTPAIIPEAVLLLPNRRIIIDTTNAITI
jgi:hypothetical protein